MLDIFFRYWLSFDLTINLYAPSDGIFLCFFVHTDI